MTKCADCGVGSVPVMLPGYGKVGTVFPCEHNADRRAEQQARRVAMGRALRADRLKRDLTLRQRAAELGVDFVELSKLENGKL